MATINFINYDNGDRVVIFNDPEGSGTVIPLTALQATAFAASLRQVATGQSKASVCPLGAGMNFVAVRVNLEEIETTPESEMRLMLEVPSPAFNTPINTTEGAGVMLQFADALSSRQV